MKRKMQKPISVLMSLALVLSLGVTAFANENDADNSGSTQEELEAERERKRREEELRLQQEAAAAAQNNDVQNNPEKKNDQNQDVEKKDVELKEELKKDDVKDGLQKEDVKDGLQKEDVKDELQKEDVKDELQKEDVKDELQKEDIKDGLQKEDVKDGLQKEDVKDGLQKEDVKDELQKEDVKDELQKDDVKDGLQKEDVKDELQKEDVKDELQKEDVNDELQKEDVKDELIITETKLEEGTLEDQKGEEDQSDPQLVLPLDSMFKADAKQYQVKKNALLASNSEETDSNSTEILGNRSVGDLLEDTSASGGIMGMRTAAKGANPSNGQTPINRDTLNVQGNNGDPLTGANGTASQGGDTATIKGGGTITMTTEQFKELTVKDGDLTIQAAGFNWINSLVTDSVVNIIGTGILLIDDYDLQDSGEVKLTENLMYEETGVVGSVAVFLKDKGASTSGNSTYTLINHGIPGILDESYTIPSGVNLVLPSGESLIMNSTVAVADSGSKTGYKYYSGDSTSTLSGDVLENSAELTVSSGASLTVEKGAEIRMISADSVKKHQESGIDILTPTIVLESGAKLIQNGKLTGTGGFVVSEVSGKYDTEETVGLETVIPIVVTNPQPIYEELAKDHSTGIPVTYVQFLNAWNTANPDHKAEDGTVFIIKINGSTFYVKKDGESFEFPDEGSWTAASMGNPYTGVGIQSHELGATGSGLLVDPSFKFPSGSSKVILTAAKENLWRVIVTENPKRGTWTLSVWYGDTQIFDLGITTVRARFKFDKPNDWDTKNIYVVFIDKDGKSLKAFPAKYDAITEELVFDSSLVGEFVVVQFDYQGELYSKGFYDELAKLDAVRHLVDLHNGKVK